MLNKNDTNKGGKTQEDGKMHPHIAHCLFSDWVNVVYERSKHSGASVYAFLEVLNT